MDDEEVARKPGAKASSIPFTAPENRLLSELYLANKSLYHAKSRTTIGDKMSETSQERFAAQFAQELSKLGFAARTTTQVKQRIADIRKLGHKLLIKETDRSVDTKKRKKVFVEPWLRSIMQSLQEEAKDEQVKVPTKRQRNNSTSEAVDAMSQLVQSFVDSQRIPDSIPSAVSHASIHEIASDEKPSSSYNSPYRDVSSPSISDLADANTADITDSTTNSTEQNVFEKKNSIDRIEELSDSEVKRKILEAEYRIALKREHLLDLQIKKAETESLLPHFANQSIPPRLPEFFERNPVWNALREAILTNWHEPSPAATAEVQINGEKLKF